MDETLGTWKCLRDNELREDFALLAATRGKGKQCAMDTETAHTRRTLGASEGDPAAEAVTYIQDLLRKKQCKVDVQVCIICVLLS